MKRAIKKETETRVKTIEAAREEFQKLLEEGWEKTSILYSYLLINKLLNLLLIKFLLCALPTDLETDSPNLVMPNVLDLTDTSISGLLKHFPK